MDVVLEKYAAPGLDQVVGGFDRAMGATVRAKDTVTGAGNAVTRGVSSAAGRLGAGQGTQDVIKSKGTAWTNAAAQGAEDAARKYVNPALYKARGVVEQVNGMANRAGQAVQGAATSAGQAVQGAARSAGQAVQGLNQKMPWYTPMPKSDAPMLKLSPPPAGTTVKEPYMHPVFGYSHRDRTY